MHAYRETSQNSDKYNEIPGILLCSYIYIYNIYIGPSVCRVVCAGRDTAVNISHLGVISSIPTKPF